MQKNEKYTVKIDAYTSEGAGIARIDGMVVFVPCALVGEECEILILKVTKSVAYAKLLNVIKASSERVEPACPLFPKCGGCDLWHMSYEEELKLKEQRVRDALSRIGGLDVPVLPIVPSNKTERYRNKAQFPCGDGEEGAVSGFYRSHSHDIVPSANCVIQSELADRVRACVAKWQNEYKISSYNEKTGSGFIRHVYVRSGKGGALLCLIAARRPKNLDKLCELLKKECPEVSGAVLNINSENTNVILGKSFEPLFGKPYVEDSLCGIDFKISPAAFYQVNHDMAERLYEKATDFILKSGAETALDLYCGIGTISLVMAEKLKKVIGVEVVPQAIEDAKVNAVLNGMENTEFICADAGKAAKMLLERGERPDAILVDPPRKGLSEDVIEIIKELAPKTLVYVSCDAATLARDLKILCDGAYKAISATPVDLFPRTRHVECVCLLEKNEV